MCQTCKIEDAILAGYALTPAGQPRQILTAASANPKTAKGAKLPILAAILHLSPANRSGYQTCPYASPACRYACLNTAGHGGINLIDDSNAVQRTRVDKTRWLFEYPEHFLSQLADEIARLERRANRLGLQCAVRLNGTSDLAWSSAFRVPDTGQTIIDTFPNVQFYDYTKVISRIGSGKLPSNYHLTFSLSESNDRHAIAALARGCNVAVVLRLADHEPMPSVWCGYPVVDGTEHDFRFLDPSGGYIVGLRPKGRAKRDTSGFVRDLDAGLVPERIPVLAAAIDRQTLPLRSA